MRGNMSEIEEIKREIKRLAAELEELKKKIKVAEVSGVSVHDPLGVSSALRKHLGEKEGGVFVHAGYAKVGGWHCDWNQIFYLNDVTEVSPKRVEKLVAPLANSSRVALLKALLSKARSISEITEITGLRGGELYHHLKELIRSGYVTSEKRGVYRLTMKGEIVLIIASGMAKWLEAPTEEEIGISE
ncbi:MAG: hypothetical protein DRJ32_06525 [Thermoprotei archaeon]|nr:MAG: hypothetical protein DRJ32_06525 [Thermoprotei archaeon]